MLKLTEIILNQKYFLILKGTLMQNILNQLLAMPGDVIAFVQEHLIVSIVVLVLFLFVTIFSNKFASIVRLIYIIASILAMALCFYKKYYSIMWALAALILLMIIVKIIVAVVKNLKVSRSNKQFERKALAKAAKRRGSWQNKQGYSGESKPIVSEEYKPEAMSREEIRNVVGDSAPSKTAPKQSDAGEAPVAKVIADTIDLSSLKIDTNKTLAEIIAENSKNSGE
jgi:predicted membrane protein